MNIHTPANDPMPWQDDPELHGFMHPRDIRIAAQAEMDTTPINLGRCLVAAVAILVIFVAIYGAG